MKILRKMSFVIIVQLLLGINVINCMAVSITDKEYANDDDMGAESEITQNVPIEEETTVGVSDIEISAYEKELYVDGTMSLTANVLPSNATNPAIKYVSGDENIATVSSTGEIRGISPGNVSITLQAENIIKKLDITVKVKTTSIDISNNYIVLKKGETYHLKATAQPDNASQEISYKSNNSGIATVSGNGDIMAENTGNTTIIVSNGDLSNAVTVIVNEAFNSNVQENSAMSESEEKEDTPEKVLLRKIMEMKDSETQDSETQNSENKNTESKIIEISSKDIPVITSDILKALHENNIELSISGGDYKIIIKGKDIVNYDNELLTNVDSAETGKGMQITINENKPLPGRLTLTVNNDKHYKYLYKYNGAKKKYEQINAKDTKQIEMDLEGKYLLTNKTMNNYKISIIIIAGVCGVSVVFSIIYVILKKKYWFW